MPGFDVFNQAPFSMFSLTVRVNDMPHVPMRLGQLGLFNAQGISTTEGAVERRGNTLRLVPVTARNSPPTNHVKDPRNLVRIPTFRLSQRMEIYADELQNLRAFGSENQLAGIEEEVNFRAMQVSNNIEASVELMRIGAIRGKLLGAVDNGDGTFSAVEIFDLFTEFGVSPNAEVDFDLDNATPASGALRKTCAGVIRTIRDALGGVPFSGVHAMCSTQFWDDLIAHPEVRETVKNYPAAMTLRNTGVGTAQGQEIEVLKFGGITFEEYRGSVGGVDYVEDDKAQFFPLGTPDNFECRYAPAEWWDTVNTLGLPRYMRMDPETMNRLDMRGWIIQTQQFNICTRPLTLVKGKRT